MVWLVRRFAPEAKGHGVPEVMDAIHHRGGAIRPRVALVKSLASALSIGSGGAVGREGPIVQIASTLGSALGGLARLPAWQRVTLVASGAGAGIAATFNTPIGGLLFAVELMLTEVSHRTLVPVALACGTATYLGRLAFGDFPAFLLPEAVTRPATLVSPGVLAAWTALGVLLGLVSLLYIPRHLLGRGPLPGPARGSLRPPRAEDAGGGGGHDRPDGRGRTRTTSRASATPPSRTCSWGR